MTNLCCDSSSRGLAAANDSIALAGRKESLFHFVAGCILPLSNLNEFLAEGAARIIIQNLRCDSSSRGLAAANDSIALAGRKESLFLFVAGCILPFKSK